MQYLYISYPDSEYDLAHRLAADLQAAGYMVFIDTVTEPGGMAWANETRHAIRDAGAILIIFTPDEGRRAGVRHESVLANRRNKPVYVLRRSPGDLPRYLSDAAEIDFTGEYEAGWEALHAALPSAHTLFHTPTPVPPRRPRRPPHRPNWRLWAAWTLAGIVLLVALGIAFGVIPL
ncbi:MAG: toll/interleukin-1 receptor domain-containing protein [Anaerolineae bacterium]|nr:toll/interleukin-1 receptor domain-containing protein [Anaerolineae bacterium]